MTTITVDAFKTRFVKSFTFGTGDEEVSDTDVQNAINDALVIFNQDLMPTDENGINPSEIAFGYLVAHFCLSNLDEQTMGAQPAFIQSSRSVGGMSESLQIPDWVGNSELSLYATTSFGLKYLQMIKPYCTGAVYAVEGSTTP